ncbi:dodecenoyl-CoA isomerase [Exophiala xenobiotica]|nr:dodecenoyl-CoA isomerase [Exophiala xenobiotica]
MSVTVKYRGRIAIITLNVPAKLNALTSEGYFLLADCMRKVANEPEIVVTVLTGSGRLFSALGITAEGGSTALFSRRMGFKVAAEALIMSKRIQCEELVRCGFINEVFDTGKDVDQFLDRVLAEVETRLFSKLNPSSMLHVKALMRKPEIPLFASQTVEETLGVVDSLARAARTAHRAKEGKKGARL